jgi:predicted CoA-substrate-specific enzyme activase
MTITAGIDVGSTYTKVVLLDDNHQILSRELSPTGFNLSKVSRVTFEGCIESAGLNKEDVEYVISTGMGRHQVDFRDTQVTDLTAGARGSSHLFPNTKTVLDVGGQTMKSSRLDDSAKVLSFRLNDKCAAGTGAFIEKTAHYMGYTTGEIEPLIITSKNPVTISGVCAVFAESEVINHLSLGSAPADIMQGSIESLVGRCVQLMKRVKGEPEFTLVGGILRFSTFATAVRAELGQDVNVPDESLVQFTSALGAASLGQRRIEKIRSGEKIISLPS